MKRTNVLPMCACVLAALLTLLSGCTADETGPFRFFQPRTEHHYTLQKVAIDTLGDDAILLYLDEPLAYPLSVSGEISFRANDIAQGSRMVVWVEDTFPAGQNPVRVSIADNISMRLKRDYLIDSGLEHYFSNKDKREQFWPAIYPPSTVIIPQLLARNAAEMDSVSVRLFASPDNTAYWREDQVGNQEIAYLLDCRFAKGKLVEDLTGTKSKASQLLQDMMRPSPRLANPDSVIYRHFIGQLDTAMARKELLKLDAQKGN